MYQKQRTKRLKDKLKYWCMMQDVQMPPCMKCDGYESVRGEHDYYFRCPKNWDCKKRDLFDQKNENSEFGTIRMNLMNGWRPLKNKLDFDTFHKKYRDKNGQYDYDAIAESVRKKEIKDQRG